MGSILVTGGAGYIGCHIVRALREGGRAHVVLDDLTEGHAVSVAGSALEVGNVADRETLSSVIHRHEVEWVIHMAASSLVGESMTSPGKYWRNNLAASLILLEACHEAGVRGLVFSSTAAVYGEPIRVPLEEDHPCAPTNVYGETKLAVERAIASYHAAHGFRSICLRYFNAAGAAADGTLGEDHARETHLIPLVLGAALGTQPPVTVLGTDYPTPDGTGIRDYIHVEDLAEAHLLALEALESGAVERESINLGGGDGRSVREVLELAGQIAGKPIPAVDGPRRAGDPAVLVASSSKAGRLLGWRPGRSDLRTIIESAWRWHSGHPRGYGA